MRKQQENTTIFADLVFDFDGVLHSYRSGWKGIDIIPDPPVPGAIPMLYSYLETFRCAIFSARSAQPEGREAMKTWLAHHDEVFRAQPIADALLPIPTGKALWDAFLEKGRLVERIAFPKVKPAAKVYIDDRAYRFDGTWPDLGELQRAAQPWYK